MTTPTTPSTLHSSSSTDPLSGVRTAPSASEEDLSRLAALLDSLSSHSSQGELERLCSHCPIGIRAQWELKYYAREARALRGAFEEEWEEGCTRGRRRPGARLSGGSASGLTRSSRLVLAFPAQERGVTDLNLPF